MFIGVCSRSRPEMSSEALSDAGVPDAEKLGLKRASDMRARARDDRRGEMIGEMIGRPGRDLSGERDGKKKRHTRCTLAEKRAAACFLFVTASCEQEVCSHAISITSELRLGVTEKFTLEGTTVQYPAG